MKRPSTLGLRHLALFVSDEKFEETNRFYQEIMGMKVDWQPDPDNVYLSSGSDNFALHRARKSLSGEALDHLGFMMENAESVGEWHEWISSQAENWSIEILTPVKKHRDGATSFYLLDPAGHKVQLLHVPNADQP